MPGYCNTMGDAKYADAGRCEPLFMGHPSRSVNAGNTIFADWLNVQPLVDGLPSELVEQRLLEVATLGIGPRNWLLRELLKLY